MIKSSYYHQILKTLTILRRDGLVGFMVKFKNLILSRNQKNILNNQYLLWLKSNYPSTDEQKKQRKISETSSYQPKISIITPTYNTPLNYLKEFIESVINQSYANWELCIVDDASTDLKIREMIKEYSKKDKRIKYLFREKNGHICRTSNDALKLATGAYVGFLDHDDFLWPNALYEIASLINKKPHLQFIYTDEDKIEENGKTHVDPFFKPDWSPDYLRTINYITHFTVIKKSLIDKIGGFRLGYEGAQDWDLYLRATYELEKENHCHPLDKYNPIHHLPKILYSWRKSKTSTASEKYVAKAKNYAFTNQKKVLENDLKMRNIKGKILSTKYLGLWQTQYKIVNNPLISIIIPTKNQFKYINACLNSIVRRTTYNNYELIIIDTGSSDKQVFKLYNQIKKIHSRTNILYWEEKFNYSAVCNYGVEKSRGEYLLFLNNDTEIITSNWLELMLGNAQNKKSGAIGVKLLYPNSHLQHGGVILGLKSANSPVPLAGHAFKTLKNGQDYFIFNSMIYGVRNISAVTAACLMVNRKLFTEVKGFDEKYAVAFNDVDFCLKLLQKGYFNVYNGTIEIVHHGSTTIQKPENNKRNLNEFIKESRDIYKKWREIYNKDPYLNINFSRNHEIISLR